MKVPGFLVKVGLGIKQAAPDISIGTGLILTGVTGYLIYKQTSSLSDILDEQNEKMDEIIEQYDEDELESRPVKRELAAVKAETFGRVLWHYTPVIATGVAGAGFTFAGIYGIKKRYLAAVGAATMWRKAYDTVMERALEKYGEEGVRYLKYGTRREEREVIDDKGNVTKEVIEVSDERMPIKGSVYAVLLDETTELYRSCQGDIGTMEFQAGVYARGLNEQYNAGLPVYYDDVIKIFCGVDSPYRNDELRNTGWYKRDLENRDAGDDFIDLHITRVITCDEDGVDKVYLRMDPNVPGPISLNAGKNRIRRIGGKYLSQI